MLAKVCLLSYRTSRQKYVCLLLNWVAGCLSLAHKRRDRSFLDVIMSDLIFFPGLGLLEGHARPTTAMVSIPILSRPLSAATDNRRPLTAQSHISNHKMSIRTSISPARRTTRPIAFKVYDSPSGVRRPAAQGKTNQTYDRLAAFIQERSTVLTAKEIEYFLKPIPKPRFRRQRGVRSHLLDDNS